MLLENLPHECSIYRRSHTKGPTGGRKATLVTVASGVACWEQSVSSSEAKAHQKSGTKDLRKIYFTTKYELTTRHLIKVTKRQGTDVAAADQEELTVIGIPQPDVSVGRGILYRIMCAVATQENS